MPKSSDSAARSPEDVPPQLPPARTPERRAQQVGMLALDLIEERVRLGTASPTESTFAARMAAPVEVANLERIRAQTAYLQAQKEKAEAETFRGTQFEEAMAAMRVYRGLGE